MGALSERLHRHGLPPRLQGTGDRLQAGTLCCGPMDQVSVEPASSRAQELMRDSAARVACDLDFDVWSISGAVDHRFGQRFPAVRLFGCAAAQRAVRAAGVVLCGEWITGTGSHFFQEFHTQ